jgi:hypothetical protein
MLTCGLICWEKNQRTGKDRKGKWKFQSKRVVSLQLRGYFNGSPTTLAVCELSSIYLLLLPKEEENRDDYWLD